MRDLNFFQAERLVYVRRRAVRRVGWDFWWIFRGVHLRVWWEDGVEKRDQMDTLHWTGAEFLAKDFTDEPWEGGSFPACSAPEASQIPPLLGAGTFTLDPLRCGGAGNGGLTLIDAFPPGTGGAGNGGPYDDPPVVGPDDGAQGTVLLFALSITAHEDAAELERDDSDPYLRSTAFGTARIGGVFYSPDTPRPLAFGEATPAILATDGTGCWVAPPATCLIRLEVTTVGGVFHTTSKARTFLTVSKAGDDLTAPLTPPFFAPEHYTSNGSDQISFPVPSVLDATRVIAHVHNTFTNHPHENTMIHWLRVPIVPGGKVTVRAQFGTNDGIRQTKHASYSFAPVCP